MIIQNSNCGDYGKSHTDIVRSQTDCEQPLVLQIMISSVRGLARTL